MKTLSGGCLCQAIRYRIVAPPLDVCNCHCSSCRRASGAAFSTWVVLKRESLRWTPGEPCIYTSSPGVQRGFCSTCGTPLIYRSQRWPDECDLMLGTLDEPSVLAPTRHIWVKHALPWLPLNDGLSRHFGDGS